MNTKYLIVHLLHIFIIGPLFLYVGLLQSSIPIYIYYILFILGIYLIFYQGFKAYNQIINNINPWVPLFHLIIIVPILLYIGYLKTNTPSYIYQFMIMLGFATIGYHLYYALMEI